MDLTQKTTMGSNQKTALNKLSRPINIPTKKKPSLRTVKRLLCTQMCSNQYSVNEM